MRQCAHERHLAEVLWQENKPLGISLHGRMRFVSPFCGMSKKRNRKRAVATQDKENSLNEKRKRRLKENHERAKKRTVARAVQRATPLRSRFPYALPFQRRVLVCGAAQPSRTCL